MKVRIAGAQAPYGEPPASRQYASTYLINDTVAIDAGCLGFYGTSLDQARVRHVFLTHSHSDHIAGLPMFLENVYGLVCPVIHGEAVTLDAIQRHVFNDVVWPDFVALSRSVAPFLRLEPLVAEQTVEVEGLRITPIAVNHVVPTVAYMVSDSETTVVFGADSGPTNRLWQLARENGPLEAVFLEASFPDEMRQLAEISLHLTPEMFAGEVRKMPPDVRVIAVHLKQRYSEEIAKRLRALPGVEIGECDRDYVFAGLQ